MTIHVKAFTSQKTSNLNFIRMQFLQFLHNFRLMRHILAHLRLCLSDQNMRLAVSSSLSPHIIQKQACHRKNKNDDTPELTIGLLIINETKHKQKAYNFQQDISPGSIFMKIPSHQNHCNRLQNNSNRYCQCPYNRLGIIF